MRDMQESEDGYLTAEEDSGGERLSERGAMKPVGDCRHCRWRCKGKH
jgi:hypothetical protein